VVIVPRLWPGATFVCIGGGPSLTREDVDRCRQVRAENASVITIAINDAYRLAPWADVLYACDDRWWRWQHGQRRQEIDAFTGLRYSIDPRAARQPGVRVLRNTGPEGLETAPTGLRTGKNSGYQAINLAVHLGAARILLLGYDMQRTANKEHWFGDHPLPTRSPYAVFRVYFRSLVRPLAKAGVEVINCSRTTALDTFPLADLDEMLGQIEAAA
jgi:hypothetical protein